jgi:uncharacterized protein YifE (UPF0438 family)
MEPLSERDRDLIERYGAFYRALNGGQRQPATPAQLHFVEVCRGRADPQTEHEVAFSNYVRWVKAMRELEEAQKLGKLRAEDQSIEDAPGQRNYPSRLDAKLTSAAAWARKNGFRGV